MNYRTSKLFALLLAVAAWGSVVLHGALVAAALFLAAAFIVEHACRLSAPDRPTLRRVRAVPR